MRASKSKLGDGIGKLGGIRQALIAEFVGGTMTLTRGFTITMISGIAFASLGALAGWGLGAIAPDYYRTLLMVRPDASMTQIGLGLGVTQGFPVGLIIGVAIVAIVAWYNSRTQVKSSDEKL